MKAPYVKFNTKVNLPFVLPNGEVSSDFNCVIWHFVMKKST